MQVYHQIQELSHLPGPLFLAVGVFDGLHLGHQAVIQRARTLAENGGSACVVSFDPHPARVLRPEAAPRLLTSTLHKTRLLEESGLEALLLVEFTHAFASTPAMDFIDALLGSARPLGGIVVGHEWCFGRNREGDLEMLCNVGSQRGFLVEGITPVTVQGERVSSTRVREAIQRGDLRAAASMLGRNFSILGRVEPGRQIGRSLGFPTANLSAHNEQFPPDGVYVVEARLEGQLRRGVANIGIRPTVEPLSTNRRLEVHFLDMDLDLYEQEIEVHFLTCLRGEKKFDGLEALKAQIQKDIEAAIEFIPEP